MAQEQRLSVRLTTDIREKEKQNAASLHQVSSPAEETTQTLFKRMILETLLECLEGCVEDFYPDGEFSSIPLINANLFRLRIEERLLRMKE